MRRPVLQIQMGLDHYAANSDYVVEIALRSLGSLVGVV